MTVDDPGAYTAPLYRPLDDFPDNRINMDCRRRDVRIHLPGHPVTL